MGVLLAGSGGGAGEAGRALGRIGALAASCPAAGEGAAAGGGRAHGSLDAALESGGFDSALVCAGPDECAGAASRLVRAGKHVMVDWDGAGALPWAEELGARAARRRVVLAFGGTDRFEPAARAARREIASGRRGRLAMLEVRRAGAPGRDADAAARLFGRDVDTAAWLFGRAPSVVFARDARRGGGGEGAPAAAADASAVVAGFGEEGVAVITSAGAGGRRSLELRATCAEAVVSADLVARTARAEPIGGGPAEAVGVEEGDPREDELRAFVAAAGGGALDGGIRGAGQASCVAGAVQAALLSGRSGAPIYLDLRWTGT